MQKKLTITVDERVYDGLHTVIGRRHISQFIESLVRPFVIGKDSRKETTRATRLRFCFQAGCLERGCGRPAFLAPVPRKPIRDPAKFQIVWANPNRVPKLIQAWTAAAIRKGPAPETKTSPHAPRIEFGVRNMPRANADSDTPGGTGGCNPYRV